jgi:hypothetical protein
MKLSAFFLLFFFSVCPAETWAQKGIQSPDSLSYAWYLKAQWDSLIQYKDALLDASGGDYFYLRYRIAEAYFREGDYDNASAEFSKAHQLNSADTSALQFLSASLLYNGRWLEYSKTQAQLKKLIPQHRIRSGLALNYVSADYGKRFSSSDSLAGDIAYMGVNAGFSPFGGCGVVLSAQDVRQNYYYGNSNQQSLYTSATIAWLSGVSAFAAGNVIQVRFDPIPEASRRFFNYQSISGGIRYKRRHWAMENEFSMANFGYENNFQNTALIHWDVYGNGKLRVDLAYIQRFSDSGNGSAVKSSAAGRINKHLYWQLGAYYGNTINLLENRSFIVSNSLDRTNYRAQAGLFWYPLEYLHAYTLYSYENRNEAFTNNAYQLNGFIAGIQFYPAALFSGR